MPGRQAQGDGVLPVVGEHDQRQEVVVPDAHELEQEDGHQSTGIALLAAHGRPEWLDRPEDRTPLPSRMNDGVADPASRFWAGSMAYDGTCGAGSLYRTDLDGTVVRVLDGLTSVNGPAFTAEGTTLDLPTRPTARSSAAGGVSVPVTACFWRGRI
ncbi:SMP-30/gluconolactonase/LRE family protein [Streptomyces sp. NPDC126510]|uniref:SMP-30/gluconolactonase/LRE family protein n=1 Tax=Streptomyces sp. NPDC126510 TaxID=3155317 RepID=UPI00331F9086